MDSNARDPDSEAYLADRKYFNISNKMFMKRTLRQSEWKTTSTGNWWFQVQPYDID